MPRSKLGFHIDISSYPGEVEKLIFARPAVIKVISSMGTLNVLHDALGDDTVFVARDWQVSDDFLRFGGAEDPIGSARRWLDALRPSIIQAPYAYWEAFNEMSNWSALPQYGDFEAERQRLMAQEGFRACIGNFATGTPEVADDGDIWSGFYPALSAAHQFKNVLGLHEYGGLWMDLWYGPNDTETLLAGNHVLFPPKDLEGWLFARYRKVRRKHLVPNGWTDVRIVLNEFGLDMAGTVVTSPLAGYTVGSWSTCGPAWARLDGRTDSAQYYVDQLIWTDTCMQEDEYLIGSTIFTWGTMGTLWKDFEIEGEVADKLVSYIHSVYEEPAEEPLPILLDWPTDYNYITQPFGARPEYYGQFGLPGHEGLDIRAPNNTRIYACADGTVSAAYYGGNYGNQLRIIHGDGFQTIYAHLNERLVGEGDSVVRGQVIGLADSTGNSTGSHLHLTLKKEGATARGETSYPSDIVDPTPYMVRNSGRLRATTTSPTGQWVRIGPSTEERAVAKLAATQMVDLLSSDDASLLGTDSWVVVLVPGGFSGWMQTKYLELVG